MRDDYKGWMITKDGEDGELGHGKCIHSLVIIVAFKW
jgi:hypothetical protein